MDKFNISTYKCFKDLPLKEFNLAGYSIYVIDKEWRYLFVNDFVTRNLGKRAMGMPGKNMWEFFPELTVDPTFIALRLNTEKKLDSNFITISPLTQQRLHITGHPLSDCNIFTSSILPKREEVLSDLRTVLNSRKVKDQ